MRVSFTLSNSKKKLYVASDEIIELALTERTQGHVIDVIKPSQDARIKAARAKDKSLGIFVAYRHAGARA
jgi:hypothetical protein